MATPIESWVMSFTTNQDGTVSFTIRLDSQSQRAINAQDVAALIEALGELRPSLQPPIPMDLPAGPRKVNAIPDPRWYVEPEMMEGNSLLNMRDPRFGWLHYVLPRNEARKLGELLIRQADSPAPGSGTAN